MYYQLYLFPKLLLSYTIAVLFAALLLHQLYANSSSASDILQLFLKLDTRVSVGPVYYPNI